MIFTEVGYSIREFVPIEKNRRNLKDEMVIIHNVIAEVDTTKVSKERTQKAINGLFSRKYRYRIVEIENGE